MMIASNKALRRVGLSAVYSPFQLSGRTESVHSGIWLRFLCCECCA